MHKRGKLNPGTSRKMQFHESKKARPGFNIKERIVFWRRVTRTLKDIYVNNKDIVNNETHTTLPMNGNVEMNTVRCESQLNPEGQGEALPVSDRETCPRGCEGLDNYAGLANSANDHPP